MKATFFLAAAALLAATGARAQDTQPAAAPTCAEQGKQLIAVMVPLGRTEAEVRALADSGALAPRGTADSWTRTPSWPAPPASSSTWTRAAR